MTNNGPVYLDCAATTPLDADVRATMLRMFDEDFGNEGSRTHGYGARAKQAVQIARAQIAHEVSAQREEVIFTSGATESNNLAILGIETWARRAGKTHVVSTQIEHKAVLEPLEELRRRGFQVELVPPNSAGSINPLDIATAIKPETALVSVMHINNETGVVQPIEDIADLIRGSEVFFHVDAAQSFGKQSGPLRNSRIDLISLSSHKIFGPKGVGALVARRRGFDKVPLAPLTFGGGQERGLRPGTLPVPLIAAFGVAAEIAAKDHEKRMLRCKTIRDKVITALMPLNPRFHGDPAQTIPHIVNLSFPGLDSEAVMLALKDEVAISNGSACTSASYTPSHVLAAMHIPAEQILGSIRMSWCHLTPDVNWARIAEKLRLLFS